MCARAAKRRARAPQTVRQGKGAFLENSKFLNFLKILPGVVGGAPPITYHLRPQRVPVASPVSEIARNRSIWTGVVGRGDVDSMFLRRPICTNRSVFLQAHSGAWRGGVGGRGLNDFATPDM